MLKKKIQDINKAKVTTNSNRRNFARNSKDDGKFSLTLGANDNNLNVNNVEAD